MESWVGVSGYENRYAISDQGRVWSYKNQIFLKPGVSSNGYHTVSLWHPNHPRKSWLVQELVLSSFVRARTPGDVCRHLDGSKLNNVLGNLAWGTPAENRADADRHGTSVRGAVLLRKTNGQSRERYPPPERCGVSKRACCTLRCIRQRGSSGARRQDVDPCLI